MSHPHRRPALAAHRPATRCRAIRAASRGPIAPPRPGRGRRRRRRPRAARGARSSALRALPDHRLLDRLLRSRAWIWLIGVVLGGIVFMQVSLLKLNTGISRASRRPPRSSARTPTLETEVAAPVVRRAHPGAAAGEGMVAPAPATSRFVRRAPASTRRLARAAHEVAQRRGAGADGQRRPRPGGRSPRDAPSRPSCRRPPRTRPPRRPPTARRAPRRRSCPRRPRPRRPSRPPAATAPRHGRHDGPRAG